MSEAIIAGQEEWRSVVGSEGVYSVSSFGRVRRDVGGRGAIAGKILSTPVSKKGRPCVNIKGRSMEVHRLVAAAFHGPCPEGHEVNHKDGDKTNNRPANLEYGTHAHNMTHAKTTGLLRPVARARHWKARLTEEQVSHIRATYSRPSDAYPLAKALGVSPGQIQRIANGRAWK